MKNSTIMSFARDFISSSPSGIETYHQEKPGLHKTLKKSISSKLIYKVNIFF